MPFTMPLIAAIILAVPVTIYIGYPLLRPEKDNISSGNILPDKSLVDLAEKKSHVYELIRELDFEYETGKISEQDYKEMINYYQNTAVEIIKKIDVQQQSLEKEQNLKKEDI